MPRARVLVVEDDRAIREGLADALAFHGYAACTAGLPLAREPGTSRRWQG